MSSPLELVPGGEYVAHGSYAQSAQPELTFPLECQLNLDRVERVTILEGSLTSPGRISKAAFHMEIEFPEDASGSGFFHFRGPQLPEIMGVLGVTGGEYMVAGRSRQPVGQVSAHVFDIRPRGLSLRGLVALESRNWLTWSLAIKPFGPQDALSKVVSLARRT